MMESRDVYEEAVRSVMSTRAGRLFVWSLIVGSGYFDSSFEPGDPYITAFREGRRDVGRTLVQELQRLCASEYMTMQRERHEEAELARDGKRAAGRAERG